MTETYCTDKTENITTFSEVIDADCFFSICVPLLSAAVINEDYYILKQKANRQKKSVVL